MDTFLMKHGTRGPLPRVPFRVIKERILGKRYELSVAIIGDTRMRTLNRRYRRKDATTDILSFPLSEDSGEVFLSVREAARRAKDFSMTERQYLTYLFIHGCLHLKGYDHGSKMDALEKKWCSVFSLPMPH